MRNAEIFRKTNETEIRLRLELDGKGNCAADSGCGFLDHMLTAFSKHAGFDLELTCRGDRQVDDHHSVEDIGIVLGQAFKEALGEMKGIGRYGSIILPMDEALSNKGSRDLRDHNFWREKRHSGELAVSSFNTFFLGHFSISK